MVFTGTNLPVRLHIPMAVVCEHNYETWVQ